MIAALIALLIKALIAPVIALIAPLSACSRVIGTSLPHTFASQTAARNEPYADASIGNITGSNSVNVFLGLGLPWMLAALYWSHLGTGGASAEPLALIN